MSGYGKYILRGKEPVLAKDLDEWVGFYEVFDRRRVAEDHIGDVRVSTVFLSLDHNFGDGPPVLFESMIFGGPHDQYQDRYCTWDEAEAGHARIVAALREGTDPDPSE